MKTTCLNRRDGSTKATAGWWTAVHRVTLGLAFVACSSGPACSSGAAGPTSGVAGADAAGTIAKKCSFDKDNLPVGIDRKAKLLVRQGLVAVTATAPVVINASNTTIGGPPIDVQFQISNDRPASAAVELLINKIDSVSPSGDTAFSCVAADSAGKAVIKDGLPVACKDHQWGSVVPVEFEPACSSREQIPAARFIIRFNKTDNASKQTTVHIKSDGDPDSPFFTFTVQTKQGKAAINVAPQIVDFDVVAPGAAPQVRGIAIQNTGEATLLLTGVQWPLQDKTFTLKVGGKTVIGGTVTVFEPPIEVAAATGLDAEVLFAPTDDKGRKATLTFTSNASGNATVQLQGNLNVPCLLVKPEKSLDFSLVYVGSEAVKPVTVTNCGDGDVHIKGFALADDAQAVYAIKDGKLPTADTPVVLAKNAKATYTIACTPSSENKDKDGKPQPFTAKINLSDSTAKPNKVINLMCTGNAAKCPTPVIVADPGEQIEPQSVLKLKGSASYAAPPGKVVKYKWKMLSQPPGAVGVQFWPNDAVADVILGTKGTNPKTGAPVVWLTVAGEYKVQLQVWDDTGTESCAAHVFSVLVVPSVALHVELLWDTPEDKTQDDGQTADGADLDLHVVHSKAYEAQKCSGTVTSACQPDLDKDGKADPWFSGVYDVYWYTPAPKWGSAQSNLDDPGLDLDDTNGWGPENMNVAMPEDGVTYGVGVHYWDAHGFGPSIATVRIYILGALKATFVQEMNECEMWFTSQVQWPSGDLLDFGGAVFKAPSAGKIVPKYWSATSITLNACKK